MKTIRRNAEGQEYQEKVNPLDRPWEGGDLAPQKAPTQFVGSDGKKYCID